jgi:hypothetical protein
LSVQQILYGIVISTPTGLISVYMHVYMQNDGGVANNCFNLDRGGFHVTSTDVGLGASFANSDSQVGGDLYGVTFATHRVKARSIPSSKYAAPSHAGS